MKEFSMKQFSELLNYENNYSDIKLCIEPREYIYKFKHLGKYGTDKELANKLFKEIRKSFESKDSLQLVKPDNFNWNFDTSLGVKCLIGVTEKENKPIDINLVDFNKSVGADKTDNMLVLGMPRTGKTHLINNIFKSLTVRYSPMKLNLYLIEFEKGGIVSYKCSYKKEDNNDNKKHVMHLLREIKDTVEARIELFNYLGLNNVHEFREKYKVELPNIVIMLDELRVFLERLDKTKLEAVELIEFLVENGSKAGVNMIITSHVNHGWLKVLEKFNYKFTLGGCREGRDIEVKTTIKTDLSNINVDIPVINGYKESIYSNKYNYIL